MTDSVVQAIGYAIHDRAGSWHGRYAPDERQTHDLIRSKLAEPTLWHEAVASEVAIQRILQAPNGKRYGITYLPLASFAIRYWVVMQIAERIDALWTARIGTERLSSRSQRSYFLGRTKGNTEVYQAWIKSQNSSFLLKVDITSFFGSISHDGLCGVIDVALGSSRSSELQMAMDLLPSLLSYSYRLEDSAEVLVCSRGLPIGNTTERFFSNAYLGVIDDFMLSQPGVHSCRKLDDMRIFSNDRDQLEFIRKEIETRLHVLGLQVNPLKTRIIKRGQVEM